MAEDSTANVQQSDLFEVKDGVLFYGESPAE